MKIGFTTDTHLVLGYEGMTTAQQLQDLRDVMLEDEPDLILHGGDVGEVRVNPENFTEALKILKAENVDCAAVIGNHDLWTNPGAVTSKDLWTTVIPKMCRDCNWHYLEEQNYVKDGVAVVGSYLHYDYSAQDPEGASINHIRANFPDWTPDEYYERMKKRVVNDAKFIIGLPRDKEFAETIGQAFRQRLLDAEQNEQVEKIVIVTHVPCMPSQITRKPYNWHWSCSTAYFGNLSHVETIMACKKVCCVLSGHSHQNNRELIERENGLNMDIINLGADYAKPLHITVEV